jgi:uncharacterized protein (TIGR00255 family)
MTGFGRGAAAEKGTRYVVEVRSTNSRYCEVRVQAPKELLELEHDLAQLTREAFSRGKFDVLLKMERLTPPGARELDEKAILRRWRELDRIRKMLGLREPVRLESALESPSREATPVPSARRSKLFEKAARAAFGRLKASRLKEGAVLVRDMARRVRDVERNVLVIESRARGSAGARFARLQERVRQLLGGPEPDPARMQAEIAMLAEKADVTEEIVRLKSHLARLESALREKADVGRKMDFLLQEVNREINTIGSKSADLDVTDGVVAVKAEIEKIREQAQNLE